jgi:hypothetical protein
MSGETSLNLMSNSITNIKGAQSLVLEANSYLFATSETLASIYSSKEVGLVSNEKLFIQKTGQVGALSISSSADLDVVGENIVFAAIDTMSLFGASGIKATTSHLDIQADQLDLAAYSLVNITGAKVALIFAVDQVNLGAGTKALKFYSQYTEFNSSMINFTATGELSMNGSTVRSYADDIVQFGSDKRVYFFSKEFIDFTYEVDSIIDLLCDVPIIKNQVELKNSEVIFDQYETMKNERLVPAMLASSMASHFLSPNGYLAFTTNYDSLTSPKEKKLVQPNFLDLMRSRVIMQSSVTIKSTAPVS